MVLVLNNGILINDVYYRYMYIMISIQVLLLLLLLLLYYQAIDGAHLQTKSNMITSLTHLPPSLLVSGCKSGILKLWSTNECQPLGMVYMLEYTIIISVIYLYSLIISPSLSLYSLVISPLSLSLPLPLSLPSLSIPFFIILSLSIR